MTANPAKTHATTRTSPKGGPYLRRCIQCGAENLTIEETFGYCENIIEATEAESLLVVINGGHQ